MNRLSDSKIKKIRELKAQGLPVREIGGRVHVSPTSVVEYTKHIFPSAPSAPDATCPKKRTIGNHENRDQMDHSPTNLLIELGKKIDKLNKESQTNRRIDSVEQQVKQLQAEKTPARDIRTNPQPQMNNGKTEEAQKQQKENQVFLSSSDPSKRDVCTGDTRHIVLDLPKGMSLAEAKIILRNNASESMDDIDDPESIEDTVDSSGDSIDPALVLNLVQKIPEWARIYKMIENYRKYGIIPTSGNKKTSEAEKTTAIPYIIPLDIKELLNKNTSHKEQKENDKNDT